VLIPVRDRAAELDRCLASVGRGYPVVVVDDGSADPTAVAAVAGRHGAALLRREAGGGPAAARNTGLAAVGTELAGTELAGTELAGTELIAFLDSDCVPPPDWIRQLAAHFADPLVGAAAPRVVESAAGDGPGAGSVASRYASASGSLDMGAREARVVPLTRVAYVPTAALVVRRAALQAVTAGQLTPGHLTPGRPTPGRGLTGATAPPAWRVFDPALRYGEDVDLVWRLNDAGWRIRYDPAIEVCHHGPQTWAGLLGRRFRYGTSAAPLARRHPGRLVPLVLQPWPAVTVAALLARRPVAAAAAVTAGWLNLTQIVRRAGLPADGAPAATLTAVRQTWLGAGKYATQFAAPALAAAIAAPGGRTPVRRWGRRAAAASLLLGPALDAWQQTRPALDPVRYCLGHIAADVAYGAGVWAGCARERTLAPATPVISWHPLRVSGTDGPAPPEHGRERG
jgi:glycosyltransferase involved in cell wall biosynthesis